MSKTLLITRSIADGEELKDSLQAMGHRVIHEPLTEIFLNHPVRTLLEKELEQDPDAVLVTSRYGARALASLSHVRDIPLVCVGASTAHVAESMGFTRVSAAGGDVDSMIEYIADAYDDGAHFIYASAQDVRADLPHILKNYGMQATRLILYEAAAAEQLSDTLLEQLKRRQVDGALFLSQRTAQIFTDLLNNSHIVESPTSMDAFCISSTVADPLEALPWNSVRVAKKPTLDSLTECVDSAYSKG